MPSLPRCPACRRIVEWDVDHPDRGYCPDDNLCFVPEPDRPGERLAYKDGD